MSDATTVRVSPSSPATRIPTNPDEKPSPGMALCLSGGGYRAMIFHLGALIRLNQLGLLRHLNRVSSVSGGSITAGMLALKWKRLTFDPSGVATNLMDEVVTPVRGLGATTIDAESIIGGALLPGTISEWIARHYRKALFGDATLQDFPSDAEGPRFVINATSVQTGNLWRFSKPYMGDYAVGLVPNPTVPVAFAVAASSAFPPVLSPAVLELDPKTFTPDATCPLQYAPFTTRVVLSDGGVYDNLGIETAWKRCQTVLVSDAGGKMESEQEPKEDWARHACRILDVVDNQVRCLRKRQIIAAFIDPNDEHDGTYWGIRSDIADYHVGGALPAPPDHTRALAAVPTRLKALDREIQQRLINWGYAICDAAVRKHVTLPAPPPAPAPSLPYPDSPI